MHSPSINTCAPHFLSPPGERPHFDMSGSLMYLETSRCLGVVPASYAARHIREDELVMKHHGLGPMGARALAIPLVVSIRLPPKGEQSRSTTQTHMRARTHTHTHALARKHIHTRFAIGNFACYAYTIAFCVDV